MYTPPPPLDTNPTVIVITGTFVVTEVVLADTERPKATKGSKEIPEAVCLVVLRSLRVL
jgi:hypothetical protein